MDMNARIRELLPPEVKELLEKAGALAGEAGVRLYLVGGIVRDLAMQRANLDIDLVVDGDGASFASLLAERLGGSVVIHDRFGTSVVILPGKRRIDVATARTETYKHGGALPEVEFAPIEADLERRDFSINAMAVSLNPGEYGKLLDYFDGLSDIEHKRIRVLNHGSFIDDPTRIFRAVRFEQRFAFRMTGETEKLMLNGVEDGLLKTISGARIRNEIRAIFAEEDAAHAVGRLQEFGVWNALEPGVNAGLEAIEVFRKIIHAESVLKSGLSHVYKRYYAFIKALLISADREAAAGFCRLINTSASREKEILSAISDAQSVVKRLDSCSAPSEIWEELNGRTDETIVFFFAIGGEQARASIEEFMKIRKEKPLINGRDLVALGYEPSARFAGVLKEVLKAQLDGQVKTASDERAMAVRLMDES